MNESAYSEEDINDVSIEELNIIREKIEAMPKYNQIEVLRLLSKCKGITLNENKYGIHINLTDISKSVVENLKIYLNYVNVQEVNLNEVEMQKEQFKNIYFAKDNKDIHGKMNKND